MTHAAPDTFPPFPILERTVDHLARAGIPCALGGSGLLSALGLAAGARDWDVTTDAPLERVLECMRGQSFELSGHSGIHADHKLRLDGGALELIVCFTMTTETGLVRLPTLSEGSWLGIPLGSPVVWAVAYRLMERHPKADLVLAHLRAEGASRAAVERMLAQPLPPRVRADLKSLPLR